MRAADPSRRAAITVGGVEELVDGGPELVEHGDGAVDGIDAINALLLLVGIFVEPLPALFIFNLSVASGDFEIIKNSLAAIERAIGRTDLLITGVSDIGQHYATTLRAWRMRFLEQLDTVRAMGFDERFIRMWDYYLALSEAGFATGVSQDLQLVLAKRRGTSATSI